MSANPHGHNPNPRAYHRRANGQLDASGNVTAVCGARVHYQQSMGSFEDVDCCCCLAVATADLGGLRALRASLAAVALTKGEPPAAIRDKWLAEIDAAIADRSVTER